MRQLTRLQSFIFKLGGILIIIGVLLWIPKLSVAPYLFCLGAVLYAVMQFLAKYEGRNFIIRRLRRQQLAGACLLVLAGIMMIGSTFHWPYTTRNEWLIAFMAGTIFQLYTAFRIPAELKKEER